MRSASRRVGRKGERRALEVGGLMVPDGIPAVMGPEPLVSMEVYVCLRRAAIVVGGLCIGGEGKT